MKTLRPVQWTFVAILALAAILRFQNLAAIQHNVDHAYPIWQALMTLDRGVWPVTAQGTSALFANPALTGYLLIPWVALTRSPLGPYLFVIALNTLAVRLAYRAAVLLLDERRALIAAFLMAINPWVIEYSRTTWVQALIPVFACLVFWLLIPVLLNRSAHPGRRIILALIALTAMTQTYLLAFLVLIPVMVLLIIYRKGIPWRSAAVGLAILAFATGIYSLGLAANGSETAARLREFASGAPQLTVAAWTHAVRLVSGENYAVSRGMDAPISDWVLREHLSEIVHGAILVALLAGIAGTAMTVIAVRRSGADRIDPLWIALIWFALPVVLMSYVSKPVHPFYLLLTLPAGYVLAARGAGYLLRWRGGTVLLVAAAVPIAALLGINTLRFSENTLALPGTYRLGALPVGAGIDMVRDLLPADALRPGAVVFADVDEWTLNSLAGRLFPVDRDVNVSQTTCVPTGGAVYLFFGNRTDDPARPVGASDSAAFDLDDGTTIRRYRVLPDTVATWLKQPIQGDRGIAYLGAQIEQPPEAGKTAALLTYWRIDELQTGRVDWLFGPFVHVYDPAGRRVAIGSGAVIPGSQWRLGDVQIQRIAVSIPADAAGPFTLQTGQYDGVHNTNVLFTLPGGATSATIAVQP